MFFICSFESFSQEAVSEISLEARMCICSQLELIHPSELTQSEKALKLMFCNDSPSLPLPPQTEKASSNRYSLKFFEHMICKQYESSAIKKFLDNDQPENYSPSGEKPFNFESVSEEDLIEKLEELLAECTS